MGGELWGSSGRFAILTHDHPLRHWDFLLEAGPIACTWRLLSEPAPDQCIPAERIANHRLLYLDYEGPISGNRGTVTRWDAGVYVTKERMTDRWRVELRGTKFCGEVFCEPSQVTFGALGADADA